MQAVDYRNYVIKSTRNLLAYFLQAMQKKDTQLNHMHVNMAALLSLVAIWTKDVSLYRQSCLILNSFLQQFARETSNINVYKEPYKVPNHSCPFTGYPLMMCLRNLQSTETLWNQVAMEWDLNTLQQRISDVAFVFCRPMQRGDHNQAMARALGTAQALLTLHSMDAQQRNIWNTYIEETWEEWKSQEDTCENAPSYNAIYLWCLLMMLDLYPNQLKYFMHSKRARFVFERYRDQISPSFCTIPKYGDDGGPGDLFFRSADAWPAIFEKVASIFQDDTFQWAALQIFRGEKDGKHHPTRQPQMLFMLAMASNWKSSVPKVLTPTGGSSILHRRRDIPSMPEKVNIADKIVLAQSRYPGTPFAMFEIFSRGHHSHFHPGSLIWYDNGQHAMFTSLGYHNGYQNQANSVFIDRYEPQRYWYDSTNIYGEWQLCSIPTALLKPFTSENQKLRIIEGITYRFENPTNSPIHLQIANVHLEGPFESLFLEHFDDPRFHMRNAQVVQTRSTDNTEFQTFLDISALPGVSFNSTDKNTSVAPEHVVFDSEILPYLKFWWRIECPGTVCLKQSSFIVRTSDALYDITPLNPKFLLHFDDQSSVVLHNSEGDQLTRFRFFHYGEDEIEFGRFAVLLKEGILLVIDKVSIPDGSRIFRDKASVIWHVLGNEVSQELTLFQRENSENCFNSIWAELCGFPHVSSLRSRKIDPDASLLFITPQQNDQTLVLVEPAFWGVTPKSIVMGQRLETSDKYLTFVSLFYPKKKSLDSENIVAQTMWNELSSSRICSRLFWSSRVESVKELNKTITGFLVHNYDRVVFQTSD